MKTKRLLEIMTDIDAGYIAEAAPGAKNVRKKRVLTKWAAVAACVALLFCACAGSVAFVVQAQEYQAAVRFFSDYGMSTAGLTRAEVRAVYRDITTRSFTYSKTAQVIQRSISPDRVGGYEILQGEPTPQDVENLWNYKNYTGGFIGDTQQGIHYKCREEYRLDAELGFEVHDKSYIEKYDGENLVWSVAITEFWIEGCSLVSDGVIAYGRTATWSSSQISHAWMAKINADGQLLWKKMLSNGFRDEYIAEILENADGSYAVFSRGDLKFFCLSQYAVDGRQLQFAKTEVGNCGIWNAVSFGDGYIVQLGSYLSHDSTRLVKVNRDGTMTDSFSYSAADAYYYITDMIEFDGKVYLSGYAVPRLADEDQSAGSRHEIAAVLNHLFEHNIWEISSEELTPLVRENYTAVLLVCEPAAGTPQEFYSVQGSLGGRLSISEANMLLWDVESITTTFYSPATSSFSIGGTSYVFRYTFDDTGALIGQEKTGEVVNYRR